MSVIVELSLPAESFQLGRILATEGNARISLETMVPLGNRSIPLFRHHGSSQTAFETRVREHPAVADIQVVNAHDDETLYALDWQIDDDAFLAEVVALDGHLLEATGGTDAWGFELRFPSHAALSEFQEHCFDADLPLDIKRIYNPTKPSAGPWYGLTDPQREMLMYAVEAGYYSLPRRASTQEIADEFGISDQAVTERLRRAIETLVTNTLLLAEADETD